MIEQGEMMSNGHSANLMFAFITGASLGPTRRTAAAWGWLPAEASSGIRRGGFSVNR